MRIEEHLSKEQKQQLQKMKSPKKKRKAKPKSQKKEEKVNWHDIMGTNNRGLRRKKGGAWGN